MIRGVLISADVLSGDVLSVEGGHVMFGDARFMMWCCGCCGRCSGEVQCSVLREFSSCLGFW